VLSVSWSLERVPPGEPQWGAHVGPLKLKRRFHTSEEARAAAERLARRLLAEALADLGPEPEKALPPQEGPANF
jgi:hypothetical protein